MTHYLRSLKFCGSSENGRCDGLLPNRLRSGSKRAVLHSFDLGKAFGCRPAGNQPSDPPETSSSRSRATSDKLISRRKLTRATMRNKRHDTNSAALVSVPSKRRKAERKSAITNTAAIKTHNVDDRIARRSRRARRTRIDNCASTRVRSPPVQLRRSAPSCLDRSTTRARRLVIDRMSNPTPEIRTTGLTAACRMDTRSLKSMVWSGRDD